MPHSAQPVLVAVGNAHIDPVWLWRWPEGLETIRATFRSALDRLAEYPGFVFTSSSAAFYAMLVDAEPDMIDQIRARVAEGRWDIVGGWWVQPDANVPSGESLVRQGLVGQRYFQELLGVQAEVGYNPDTFGHPGTLPQILAGSGMNGYYFMRPMGHEKELPGNVFSWRSADGSEVTAVRIARAYCTWPDELDSQVRSSLEAMPDYLGEYVVFYGVGNHGGGPTRANIDSLLVDRPDCAVELGGATSYVRNVRSAPAVLPVVEDDLQHHARGCYSAHSGIKQWNRRAEHQLISTERMAMVAKSLRCREYPSADLAVAWQLVLFNQFHDILAGTSLPEAYDDARDQFGHAASLAQRHYHASAQSIAAMIDTQGASSALVVFNPLPWAVRVPVEVERGSAVLTDDTGSAVPAQAIAPTTVAGQRRACFVADLPALGYRSYRQDAAQAPGPAARSLSCSGTCMENDWWHLEFDAATGNLTRLLDKTHQLDVIGAPSARLLVMDDPSDTWSHDVRSFRQELGTFSGASFACDEMGDVRACLRVTTRYASSVATQQFMLYRDIDLIEVRVFVNWQERHAMLKLAWTSSARDVDATYQIPYGHIVRPGDGEEHPGQQWIDLTGTVGSGTVTQTYGISILNDCKYGFDTLGPEMRVSVLRSPVFAHHDPQDLDPAGHYRYMDQGEHRFTYQLRPHSGPWQDADLTRHAMELHERPTWVNEYEHGGPLPLEASFLDCAPSSIVLTTYKLAESGDAAIIRGYETAGRPTKAAIRMGAELTWQVDWPAHAILTWRVPLDGSGSPAIVNLLEEE